MKKWNYAKKEASAVTSHLFWLSCGWFLGIVHRSSYHLDTLRFLIHYKRFWRFGVPIWNGELTRENYAKAWSDNKVSVYFSIPCSIRALDACWLS